MYTFTVVTMTSSDFCHRGSTRVGSVMPQLRTAHNLCSHPRRWCLVSGGRCCVSAETLPDDEDEERDSIVAAVLTETGFAATDDGEFVDEVLARNLSNEPAVVLICRPAIGGLYGLFYIYVITRSISSVVRF